MLVPGRGSLSGYLVPSPTPFRCARRISWERFWTLVPSSHPVLRYGSDGSGFGPLPPHPTPPPFTIQRCRSSGLPHDRRGQRYSIQRRPNRSGGWQSTTVFCQCCSCCPGVLTYVGTWMGPGQFVNRDLCHSFARAHHLR